MLQGFQPASFGSVGVSKPHANAGNRITYLNSATLNRSQHFRGNRIHTAKYTLLTFVPKNLFEQFRRVANIYFLVLSVLTSMPFSPKNPVSLIGTFMAVLMFSAAKEAYEDYMRHLSDADINTRSVDVVDVSLCSSATPPPPQMSPSNLDSPSPSLTLPLLQFPLKTLQWHQLEVGDLVLLRKNDEVPADCLLLATSDTDSGVCSIDSANLDGESSLKTLYAVHGGLPLDAIPSLRGRVEHESPSPSLASFRGTLHVGTAAPVLLTLNQLLLRGCSIRHTKWAVGVVLYAGHDTKSFLNGSAPPYKSSTVMHTMNRCLYFVFFVQGLLCTINAIAMLTWSHASRTPYLSTFNDTTTSIVSPNGGQGYLTFLVAYSNLIPISLYVGIEVVKLIQKYLIEHDADMAVCVVAPKTAMTPSMSMLDPVPGISTSAAPTAAPMLTSFAKCRTSNLVEELGQVELVFTDKTGTLTCNEMVFSACAIVGMPRAFAFDSLPIKASSVSTASAAPPPTSACGSHRLHLPNLLIPRLSASAGPRALGSTNNCASESTIVDVQLTSPKKQFPLEGSDAWTSLYDSRHPNRTRQMDFWLCLALCHSVAPELDEDDPTNVMAIRYQASSPDEGAMVAAARQMGIVFKCRSAASVTVWNRATHAEETYRVLNVLEFHSARRRMSIVVRAPDGRLRLFVKGADAAILKRLATSAQPPSNDDDDDDGGGGGGETTTSANDPASPHHVAWITQHLTEYSEKGLRTLCVAVRNLDQATYDAWSTTYQAANMIHDPDLRESHVASARNAIERDLHLLGMTAIEDRLQDGVPDTIEQLLAAGIRVWVLTGDKEETAINVGHACNVLRPTSRVHRLSKYKSESDMYEFLAELVDGMTCTNAPRPTSRPPPPVATISAKMTQDVMVLDGDALALAMLPSTRQVFIGAAMRCRACICCRVSPKQKAQVVQLARDHVSVVTLAIGDGANDVSMIQAAHLGIGICGHEGTQAVRASDYSIAQFRFLRKLLFVHGAWAYHRVCKFILFYFYKNMLVVFTEYWFAWSSGFSGQIYFPDMLSLAYNALFTSYPCVAGFSLDQHVAMPAMLKLPKLYQLGQLRQSYNESVFVLHVVLAMYHAALCYFIPQCLLAHDVVVGQWAVSIASFACVIVVVTIRMLTQVQCFTRVVVWVTGFSIVVDFGAMLVLSTPTMARVLQPQAHSVMFVLVMEPRFYLALVLTSTVSFLTDLAAHYIQRQCAPTPQDIANELHFDPSLAKPGLATSSGLHNIIQPMQ
ncbi:hypothetical protein, variant 3 [Aphanomyces invadans]|uniref:Phospholipid-transporting ATPase n=1 Tax=Aphanomyces invadans TaxID=157072 RepID=A0A024UJ95_9STRA|nr:hypothetical protein, variant 2 [Aphanomyces invadans]XP_008864583.1 hypothetical protein, variant 3 [Aphanomyces invadans]ETW06505.1 hypothetical protein, variant 2 [Aphanomyces invadans]ETW06506.1 hypothetical protein, variant 3 [Aphanomyces invadans]|eukprot:XP_008864580.1 hypothetical protein, variant 2 [Aphanomyces invadans]